MLKKYKIIILIPILILLSISAVFWYVKKPSNQNLEVSKESEWGNPEISLKEAEKSASSIVELGEKYTDSFLGISFLYPKDFTVSSMDDNSEEYVILVQNISKNIGIQISAISFVDSFETLTKERIEGDLNIKLDKYSIIKIGKNKDVDAVTFLTGGEVLYREVWFIKNEKLVQVKAYQSSEPLIVAILQTLEI